MKKNIKNVQLVVGQIIKQTMKINKYYREYHQKGILSIEQNLRKGLHNCDLGIAFDKSGKIWLCMNNKAIIRFTPHEPIKCSTRRTISEVKNET